MGCLKNLAVIQLIPPAVVGIVSGVTYLSTLTALNNFGYSFILFVISAACAFCVNKFLKHHRPYVSGHQAVKQMSHLQNPENISTIVNLSQELSDIREKFHRRRLSYPLQPSEKLNYTVLKLLDAVDKNHLAHNDNARRDNESKDEENRSKKKSDEMHLNLRKCISNIEDNIEKLSLITKKNISDLEEQSKSNEGNLNRAKYSKRKIKGIQSLNQNVSTGIVKDLGNISDTSTVAKQKMSLLPRNFQRSMNHGQPGNSLSLSNSGSREVKSSGSRFKKIQDSSRDTSRLQVARLVNPTARQHVISKRVLQNKQLKNLQLDLKKNNSKNGCMPNSRSKDADSSTSVTTSDASGFEEALEQRSIPDNVSLQQDTTSGPISGQLKLEQILEKPEIRQLFIPPKNKGAAHSQSGGLFSNGSASTIFDNCLNDFTSIEDIKKKLESTHMSLSSDNLKLMGHTYFHPSNVEEAFSFIWDEQDLPLSKCSSEITDLNSKTSQSCFKTMSSGIVSDFSNTEERVRHSNRDSTSSVDSKSAWSSSESIFATELSDFILDPLPLEEEQFGSSDPQFGTASQAANETFSGSPALEYSITQSELTSYSCPEYTIQAANEVSSSSQPDSVGIDQSASQLAESEKQHSKTDSKNPELETGCKLKKKKSSIFFKIRNSLKFGNNRKLHTKDKEPKP